MIDRRFLPEESLEEVQAEIEALIEELTADQPGRRYEVRDLMIVLPTRTPHPSPVAESLATAVSQVVGHRPHYVASPGTYDHKHFARLAGVVDCVAYGPGSLEDAHQPDESCSVEAIIMSAKVMALATAELLTRA